MFAGFGSQERAPLFWFLCRSGESERSADHQAQQFLQKEWCWKNETAKLEEAESFAEAAAQEKAKLGKTL